MAACLLLALPTAAPAEAQSHESSGSGAVVIEQAVGGSFALLTSNQALTAVFRPRSLELSSPMRDVARSVAAAYSAYIGSAADKVVINRGDTIEISVNYWALSDLRSGQPFGLASQTRPAAGAQVFVVLVNFN